MKFITPLAICLFITSTSLASKEIETYRKKTFNLDEYFFDYRKKIIKDKRKMGHITTLVK